MTGRGVVRVGEKRASRSTTTGVWLLSASLAIASGCGADADRPGGEGGAAGLGGTGGAAASAGFGGVGGFGGFAGTGGVAGTAGTGGVSGTGGSAGTGGTGGESGTGGTGGAAGSAGTGGTGGSNSACTNTGAAENFSFFVTSYAGMVALSGSDDGFGGDLRYNGASTGLDGADAICQELARRVCFGHRTWRAYLSTSTVNARDRVGNGPWYDHAGLLVAEDIDGLLSGDRPEGGAMDDGTYDETGIFHDGTTDVNNDGIDDDDHDTMTATDASGMYTGFSCNDWTSTTATSSSGGMGGLFGGFPGGGLASGIMMGHSWPARSGQSWSTSHAGHQCAAGTNFIQDGAGDGTTVGGGGGYGAIYCLAQ